MTGLVRLKDCGTNNIFCNETNLTDDVTEDHRG